MKKYASLVAVLLAAVLLTACTTVYVPQQNISLNYNNISAGNSPYWLENDQVFYMDYKNHHLGTFYTYHMKTKEESKTLVLEDAGFIPLWQRYNDHMYLAYDNNPESLQPEYRIYRYNLTTGEHEELLWVGNLIRFFADQTYLYLMLEKQYFDGTDYIAEIYEIETGLLVDSYETVFSCGMHNGNFAMLFSNDQGFTVKEWNPNTATTQTTATVQLTYTENITVSTAVNFTSNAMVLTAYHSDLAQNDIYIYRFHDGSLETRVFDLPVYDLVAFEKTAFFTLQDNHDLQLHTLDIATGETNLLGKIKNDKYLFVTSDEDVYICSDFDQEIAHYNLDGTREPVLVKPEK